MQKLRLDDLHVDSFSIAQATDAAPNAAITVPAYPHSLLGSCYGCPGESITICPFTAVAA
jgi:hypothetical protein